ncbi:IS256 family transposase [Bifidobacterium longum]|uniref:IS256 family transposase n=1 Tax=Bifidobacterium longum TaxID=216816 RepID=UPI0009BAC339|nr:IS256 family transposase [Bifidobacterium longum]
MVRKSVEETLNAIARRGGRRDHRPRALRAQRGAEGLPGGHYERDLTVKAGKMSLKVPKLKGAVFESAVIERYRRRGGERRGGADRHVFGRRLHRQVDDVSQLLWGDRMPSQTLSDKLKKVYADIDEWRGRPLEQDYPYLFMDGVWHKRCWGGSVENVSILVAVGVGMDGRREVLSVAEGMKEDSESWREFIKGMLARGLKGVRLVTGDRCAGLVAAVNELLPGARYQRCMVHFERNILAKVNPKNRDWAADALKAIFSMESRDKALEKAESVAKDMEARKLREAAKCLREGIGEDHDLPARRLPREHRRRIRTNNMIERLKPRDPPAHARGRQLPDGRSALMLICARVRYVTSSEWSTRRYLDMSRLGENVQSAN